MGNLEYIRNTPPTCHSLFPSPLWKHQTDKIDNRKLEKVILERERKDKGVTFNNVDGYKSQREDVRGRITDAIVYLCLLWGMVDNPTYPEHSKYYYNRQKEDKL